MVEPSPDTNTERRDTVSGWKPFKVTYTYKGNLVKEEAYLTVALGDKHEPTRQIVVLPTCGRFLAKWNSDAPCDLQGTRREECACEHIQGD